MQKSLIPHTIHYIWLGGNPKSELIERCIKVCKEKLPDWTFIEWNEKNYDIKKSNYMQQAYEQKKYAFASDYARFDILYEHGGIYLDTDVELLKDFPDFMLENKGFAGLESNNKIAPGLVFACEPKNPLVKEILDAYTVEKFLNDDGSENQKTVVEYVTEVFKKHGFRIDGSEQIIEGFHIYPSEYFCAYDFITREFSITPNTISIHHYAGTWLTPTEKIERKIKDSLRKIIGNKQYRMLVNIKRKYWGIKK